MRSLRVGEAARRGLAPAVPYPGLPDVEPGGARRRTLATALAAAVHAGVLGILFAVAALAPKEIEPPPVPIELLRIEPPPPPPPKPKPEVKRVEPKPEPPPPPKPVVKAPEPPKPVAKAPEPAPVPKPVPAPPAPAPKALAERRSPTFQPSAQTVQPQVVNPTVIAKASPAVVGERIEMNAVSSVAAPKEITRGAPTVDTVQALPSVAASPVSKVDVGSAAAPALRGPVKGSGPVGASVGPKAVATGGTSVGTGAVNLGDGSSVKEGVLSDRDVLGSADGPRLANVNTRVGEGNLRGPGGQGTTLGGGAPDCDSRPEVKAYMESIRQRTLSRWAAPPDTPAGGRATLAWNLDVGGSATRVQLVSAPSPKIGASVVDALRSASPFPPMSERVRCLAERRITGTFTLTPGG